MKTTLDRFLLAIGGLALLLAATACTPRGGYVGAYGDNDFGHGGVYYNMGGGERHFDGSPGHHHKPPKPPKHKKHKKNHKKKHHGRYHDDGAQNMTCHDCHGDSGVLLSD